MRCQSVAFFFDMPFQPFPSANVRDPAQLIIAAHHEGLRYSHAQDHRP